MAWHDDDQSKIDRKRWARLRVEVLARDGWRCVQCSRRGRLEVDHKIAMRNGGEPYALENLQVLCRQCHFDKSDKDRQQDVEGPERKEWRAYVAEVMDSTL